MKLDGNDFNLLCETKMQWAGYEWEVQKNRFTFDESEFSFKWAYWFDSYAAVILARTFLTEQNYKFAHSFDEAQGQYVLVTDYVSL